MELHKDKKVKCLDCGLDFVFTIGEQTFFLKKAFSEPKRCGECRKKRKKKMRKNRRTLLKSLRDNIINEMKPFGIAVEVKEEIEENENE